MIIYTICLVLGLMFTLFSAIAGHLFGGHGEANVGMGGQADGGACAAQGQGCVGTPCCGGLQCCSSGPPDSGACFPLCGI